MAEYLALIRKEEGTNYGVEFPDFPGAITAGTNLEEAHRAARELLAAHIEFMEEEGEEIPEPSSLDVVMKDKHHRSAIAILVPAPTLKGKAVRVNITIEENLLRAIDEYAASKGLGRSGFIAEASRALLGGLFGGGARVLHPSEERKAKRRGRKVA